MYRRLSTVKWSRALLVPEGAQTGMRIDEAVFGVTGHSKPARHSSLSAGYHSCTKPSSKFHNLESRLGIVTMDARVRTQSVRTRERERQNRRESSETERDREGSVGLIIQSLWSSSIIQSGFFSLSVWLPRPRSIQQSRRHVDSWLSRTRLMKSPFWYSLTWFLMTLCRMNLVDIKLTSINTFGQHVYLILRRAGLPRFRVLT